MFWVFMFGISVGLIAGVGSTWYGIGKGIKKRAMRFRIPQFKMDLPEMVNANKATESRKLKEEENWWVDFYQKQGLKHGIISQRPYMSESTGTVLQRAWCLCGQSRAHKDKLEAVSALDTHITFENLKDAKIAGMLESDDKDAKLLEALESLKKTETDLKVAMDTNESLRDSYYARGRYY